MNDKNRIDLYELKTQAHLDFENYVRNNLKSFSSRLKIKYDPETGTILYDNYSLNILFQGWNAAVTFYKKQEQWLL